MLHVLEYKRAVNQGAAATAAGGTRATTATAGIRAAAAAHGTRGEVKPVTWELIIQGMCHTSFKSLKGVDTCDNFPSFSNHAI